MHSVDEMLAIPVTVVNEDFINVDRGRTSV